MNRSLIANESYAGFSARASISSPNAPLKRFRSISRPWNYRCEGTTFRAS